MRRFGRWWGRSKVARFCKFGLVGGSGVAVDMLIVYLLASPQCCHWDLRLSKIVAAEVAIWNNFLWNDCWTFRAIVAGPATLSSRLRRLLRFNLICLAGIGGSVGLLQLEVEYLHIRLCWANLAAIGVVSVWNFWLSQRFSWPVQGGGERTRR
ncbi:MAG: GtrA family protein [Verrucomicrobiota bacterium]